MDPLSMLPLPSLVGLLLLAAAVVATIHLIRGARS